MNYHIVTYGCQMNVHESEKIAGILREKGYETESPLEEADIIVFNTCCIRENAENHAFGNIGALKKLKKKRKDLIIAVGGCMAQEAGKAQILREKFPFIDIVFGTHNLPRLGELIDKKRAQKKAVVEVTEGREETEDHVLPVRTSYPNAWVNIMYGCNNFCTYCIVPYVRGRERSRRAEDILSEVRSLVAGGYKEITLLGQNVNSYNSDGKGGMSFPELLDAVASVEGKFRVRFMTSHPKDFTEELAKVMAKHDKICRLLHLPVQSGSDRILSLMNRRYTREKYLSEIEMLDGYHRRIPVGDGRGIRRNGQPRQRGEICLGVHLRLFPPHGDKGGGNARSNPRRGAKGAHHAPCRDGQRADARAEREIRRKDGRDSLRGLR